MQAIKCSNDLQNGLSKFGVEAYNKMYELSNVLFEA